MKYAGWKAQYDSDSYPTAYQEESGLGIRGCFASRVIYADGKPREEVITEKPQEMDWIENFKFFYPYEVTNGWRRWESKDATKFSEGADGKSFPLFIDCSNYCKPAGSGALHLIMSGITLSLLFMF